ncbi:MAG: tyrosine-protein kinase domain-containing protein [Solirubrobacteraceae bacterium]
MTADPSHPDLRAYARIFWRWKLLFLVFIVVIPLAAYLIERGKPKVYASSTMISVAANPAPAGVAVSNGTTNITAVAQLVTTTVLGQKANLLLTPPAPSVKSLLSQVTATGDTTTDFLTITAQDHNPARAAAIATAFATALGAYQKAQAVQAINQQVAALRKQLASIPASQGSSRASVISQISQLQAQRGSAGAGTQTLQPAVPNYTPVGPKVRRALEIAFVIALLLGSGAVLLAENSDRRLRTPEDLEALTGLPLLGVIPGRAFSPDKFADPRTEESFQTLRSALTYFNIDRPLTSIAIVSPQAGDGKTTVAVGLATAIARAGRRAILVDADLRRAQVCARLGVESPIDGLGAVLAGERAPEDVLFEHDVEAPEGGQLLVLPAGDPPPNPSALMNSQQMLDLLTRLESETDVVIVDTAAALAVGDSLPVVQRASGVVMIVRMSRSAAGAVKRLHKVVDSAHGSMLGVVATGSSAFAGGYEYAYDYYQSGNGHAPHGALARLRMRLARQPRATRRRASSPASTAPRHPSGSQSRDVNGKAPKAVAAQVLEPGVGRRPSPVDDET